MHSKSSVSSETRDLLVSLVTEQRKSLGSAKLAVQTVARRVGASEMWVRKIIGRYGEAAVHAHIYLNLQAAAGGLERRATASVGTPADLARRLRARIEANLIDEEDRAQ